MKSKAVYISAAVCFLAIIMMVLSLVFTGGKADKDGFVPPQFDSEAERGIAAVENESWTRIFKDGMSFSAHVCGKIVLNGNTADIYFTNDDGNEVWLKLRILDENGNILAETGLIKPNEYIKTVTFDTVPEKGTAVKLKIMAYEPDTYYSAGAVTLNTVVGG